MEIGCSQRSDCAEQMRKAGLAQERSEQSSWRLEERPGSLRGGLGFGHWKLQEVN